MTIKCEYIFLYVIRCRIVPVFGETKLINLKATALQNYYNQLLEEGLSARTVGIIHTVLRAALKKAVKCGYLHHNICETVELPRDKKKERRVLTEEEQHKLIEKLKKDPLGNMYIFALFTGLRRGEVLALRQIRIRCVTALPQEPSKPA